MVGKILIYFTKSVGMCSCVFVNYWQRWLPSHVTTMDQSATPQHDGGCVSIYIQFLSLIHSSSTCIT